MTPPPEQIHLLQHLAATEPDRVVGAVVDCLAQKMRLFRAAQEVKSRDWRRDFGVSDLRNLPMWRHYLHGVLRGAPTVRRARWRLLQWVDHSFLVHVPHEDRQKLKALILAHEPRWITPCKSSEYLPAAY